MSLLHPTRGELLDRLSIVQRRGIERELAMLDSSYVERDEIVAQLVPGSEEDRNKYAAGAALAAVNAALWERENKIRLYSPTEAANSYAALAAEIHKLNDWRARLIAVIDGTPNPKIHS